MNNLAATLYSQRDLAGARRIQENVLTMSQRLLGQEHPNTLSSMSNLGLFLRGRGRSGGSHTAFEQVVDVRRRVLGEEHPDIVDTMDYLAQTKKAQRDLQIMPH